MSDNKQPHVRSQSQAIKDRDAQLASEANEWAKQQVRQFFETHKEGYFLPSDVLAVLDEDPSAPTAWIRWLSDYNMRYHMVRNTCVSYHKTGLLDVRTEKNSLGRDATGYRRNPDLDDWSVAVTPGDMSESVTDIVTGWLRSNPRALKGVDAILITRNSSTSNETAAPGRSGAPRQGVAPVRRRRS